MTDLKRAAAVRLANDDNRIHKRSYGAMKQEKQQ